MCRPILVSLAKSWRIASCRFSRIVSPGTQRYERYLLGLTQFSEPSNPKPIRSGQIWAAAEETSTGGYRAEYKALSHAEAGGFRIKKSILAFLPSTKNEAMSGKRTAKGSLMLVVDRQNRLVCASGTLEDHTTVDGKLTAKASSRVSLMLIRLAIDQADLSLASQSMSNSTHLYEPPKPTDQEADIERTALAESTEGELLAELDQAVQTADPSYDATGL